MVRIPSDEDQDEAEKQLRVREYMQLFRADMDMVRRHGRKKEMIPKIFKNIRKVNQIVFK